MRLLTAVIKSMPHKRHPERGRNGANMKKVIAIILSALLVACILPVAAFADDTVVFSANADIIASDAFESGTSYVIPENVTITVPAGVTLYIPANSKLTVEIGGKLIVNGAVNVQKGGELFVAGTIINSDNVAGEGEKSAELRFPEHDVYCSCGNGDDCTAITISAGIEDFTGTKVTYDKVNSGESKAIELGTNVYVKVEIAEPVAKYDMYDDDYVAVYFNGVTVPGTDGVHVTKVSTASDVTFTKFDGSEYFYTDCKVIIPNVTGYTVETSDGRTGADGEYVVKFGTPVAFKVILDEDYDQSPYEVYIHNGAGYTNGVVEVDGEPITDESGALLYISGIDKAQTDEYGYYNFTVRGDSTIHVVGVISNEKMQAVGDILSVIRNVFEMIRSFMAQILALFGITL